MFVKSPEILLADATYKLIDLRIRVYWLLAAVLDGLSEIVALFILADETKTVIEPTVNVFNK